MHLLPLFRGLRVLWQRLTFFCYFSDRVNADSTSVVYEFGPFRLEPNEHRLTREGRPIPVTGKAFDTLRVLLERHGKLVSKQDLMNAVWPESSRRREQPRPQHLTLCAKPSANNPAASPSSRPSRALAIASSHQSPQHPHTRSSAPPRRPIASLDHARQEIRFCVTPDNVRLAYATVGTGHPIVRVANCFNHLDFEWGSPIWRHWVRDLASGHSLVRYDGRGNGLSERDVE